MQQFIFSFIMLVFYFSASLAQNKLPATATELIKIMHAKYFHGPCKTYSFSQKNTLYRNDSIVGNSEWHEVIQFPDKFKINFGDELKGNFVVFRNDSALSFKENKLTKMRPDSNTLLLLIGGMYYRNIEDVLKRLNNAGYKLDVVSEQPYNFRMVYIIGARKNDLLSNQIWVDKRTYKILRIIEKMKSADMMDMRFEGHQKNCKGFVETKVSFRRNGKLEQVEEYYNIKELKDFPQ